VSACPVAPVDGAGAAKNYYKMKVAGVFLP